MGSQKSQTRLRDKTAVEAYGSGLEPMLPEQGWREGREPDQNKNIEDIDSKINEIGLKELSEKLGVGQVTLKDIIDEIKKPGRDPREDGIKPILRTDVLKIEDIQEGMILKGTIRNVVDFGAFVDLDDGTTGLVHISEVADGYVKSVADHLKVEQVVKVKVIAVDNKKVSLSIKKVLPPKKSYNKPKENKEDNLSFVVT